MDSIYTSKVLGQLRPANTTAVSIVNPTKIVKIHTIIVCNTTTSSANYRIFLDNDGTTYDQSTALFYDVSLGSNFTDIISFDNPIVLNNSSANLAVRTDTSSAFTFTVFGEERVN